MLDESPPESEMVPYPEDEPLAAILHEIGPRNFEKFGECPEFQAWCAQREAEVEAAGRNDAAQVAFEIRRGLLFLRAGCLHNARIIWEDAMMVAEASGDPTLIDQLENILNTHR